MRSRLISLCFIYISLQALSVNAQTTVCATFIRQKDTLVCPGTQVTLSLLDPPPKDSMLPGVWKLLLPGSSIDSNLFNIRAFGFDKVNRVIYSIIHKKVIRYQLATNTVSALTANNWPGDYTEFTYDFNNKRLLLWRSGRDSVYALPESGGNWTAFGPGSIDRECFGASVYWNPVNRQPGFYGGYGFNKLKSWIFENDGSGWIERKPNPLIDSVPPKGGNIVSTNADGRKLYLFSGQGNYSGDELTGTCTLGSPWATASGMYCWLRDLWELDLNTYTFTNILPVNTRSIQYEGAMGYYYDKNRFYIFGGYQPTGDYATNQRLTNTNKTFYYRRGIDTGFVQLQGEGDVPPPMPATLLNNYAYYDVTGKRMIWARFDGIWAYYPDSTLTPPNTKSVLWSTGDTASSILVKPLQTTLYRVTRTIGAQSCRDSVTITVTNMQTALQKLVNICGTNTTLDAGAGFAAYKWNTGDTTQTLGVSKSGTYTVTFQKGVCTSQDSSKVQLALPVTDFTVGVQRDSVCAGETDSLFVNTPQAGIGYTWSLTGNTTVLNTGTSYVLKIPSTLNYTVTGTSNAAICATKTATIRVAARMPLPKPVVRTDSLTTSTLLFGWDPVQQATGYEISVNRGATYTLPSSGSNGLQHRIGGLQPNTAVYFTVRATGRYSCETGDTTQLRTVTLNPFGNGIYAPNAFTPNGDGVNDTWMVYGTAIVSVRLIIYNQWGGEVFVSTDLSKGWDGTYHGQKSPAGLYSYMLEAVMQDGTKLNKGGQFSLLR